MALRSHYWGPLLIVVVSGEIDSKGAALLGSQLRELQIANDVVVDLWDVTEMDAAAVASLEAAKRRADAGGWGFALVADPAGPCDEALKAAGIDGALAPFPSRQAARAALQQSER